MSAPKLGDNVRLCMVNDLQRRFPLIGRSKAEVNELLGPPTYSSDDGATYVYFLGTRDKINNLSLQIGFEGSIASSAAQIPNR
ncbi:MAG TPA: hypothetical protein V6C97_04255 [Oculatellaceae cyanobacterium]